jgi:hypothetical protein
VWNRHYGEGALAHLSLRCRNSYKQPRLYARSLPIGEEYTKQVWSVCHPRSRTLSDVEKLSLRGRDVLRSSLAEHAGALRDLACRQAIEQGISVGRGGVRLMLTGEHQAVNPA